MRLVGHPNVDLATAGELLVIGKGRWPTLGSADHAGPMSQGVFFIFFSPETTADRPGIYFCAMTTT
jgi:hypothetical protein